LSEEVVRPLFTAESERKSAAVNLRPRDAATLIIVDGRGPAARILMGRRKASLKFMPGLYVFPGGRVDPADGRMAHVGGFAPEAIAKLADRARLTERRMAALALAAIRETYEEAGLLVGRRSPPERIPNAECAPFATHGVTPDLSALAYVCRAITPPRRPRRFDTRFFLAEASAVAVTLPPEERPQTDLEALEWLTLAQARDRPLAFITGVVLNDLEARLRARDPHDPALPVPYYFSRGDKHLRTEV